MKPDSRRYFEIYCDDHHSKKVITTFVSDGPFWGWRIPENPANIEVQHIEELMPGGATNYRDRLVFECPENACPRRVPIADPTMRRKLTTLIAMLHRKGFRELSLKDLPNGLDRVNGMLAESTLRAQLESAVKSGLPDDVLRRIWLATDAANALSIRDQRDVWRRVVGRN